MTTYVSSALRRLVANRADRLCEYCLIHEDDTFFGCEIEHVSAEKHGGGTNPDNLAYACVFCNRRKGTDIATLSTRTGKLTRLFNPRTDRWPDHFELAQDGIKLVPRTDIGESTLRLLELNHSDRLVERETLRAVGRYPVASALTRMQS